MKKRIISAVLSAAISVSAVQTFSFSSATFNEKVLCSAEESLNVYEETDIPDSTEPDVTSPVTTTAKTADTPVIESTTKPENYIGYDYEGTFFISYTNNKWNYYVGEELDESSFICSVAAKTTDGFYKDTMNSFQAYGDMLGKYYTIDTSEVDMNTPGKYKIYVDTIDDNIIPVSVAGDNQDIPKGNYNVLMKSCESRCFTTITVSDGERPAPYEQPLVFGDSKFSCPDGEIAEISLLGCIYPDVTVTSSDTSIVEIISFDMYEDYSSDKPSTWGYVKVKGNKAGQTATITAVDGNGRTATCDIFIEYSDNSYSEDDFYFESPTNVLEGYVEETINTLIKGYQLDKFYEVGESPFSFSIDDENIAILTDIQGDIVNLKGISVGETILRAEAPDGRTAEITVIVNEPEETEPAIPIPTVAYPTEISGTGVPGDMNGDGKISIADLVMLQKLINSKKEFSASSDVNRDGTVNVFDVVTLRRIILGE